MSETGRDPIGEILERFARAKEVEPHDATAAALASADAAGRPAVRMVLVKEIDERGFVIFTNYGSRKAAHFQVNPRAALCLHWPTLEVQVRVEGPVLPVSEEESDAYFASRPRDSQIGAWASRQSQPLPDRETLEREVEEVSAQYAGREVPRPPFWGGYRIEPERLEVWTGRPHRLHDREVFTRRPDGGWELERLYP